MSQVAVEPGRVVTPQWVGNGLFRNTAIFASVSLGAYLFSLAKTILVSRYFGTTPEMDAFNVSILVPNLLGALVIGSSAAGLVPGLARAERLGMNHRADVYRSALTFFVGICAVGSVLLCLSSNQLIHLIGPKLDPSRASLAAALARWSSLLFFFNAVYGFASAELLSRKRYAIVAAAPAISTMFSLIAIALFHSFGAFILVWSLVAGLVLQASVVFVPSWISSKGGQLALWQDADISSVIAGQWKLIAVSSIGVANSFIDQVIAALLPAGNISALTYASNLNMVIMQVVVMAMSSVVLTDLSSIAATSDMPRLQKRVRVCVVTAVMLATPACFSVLFLGFTAVRVLLEHGLFHADSSRLVYLAWAGYSIGLIPAAISMIASRLANALHQNTLLFRVGLLLLVINAVLDYFLMRVAGVVGITLATTVVYSFSTFLLYGSLRKHVGQLLDKAGALTLGRVLIANFLAAIPVLLMRSRMGYGVASSTLQWATFLLVLAFNYQVAGLIRFQSPVGRNRSPWHRVRFSFEDLL